MALNLAINVGVKKSIINKMKCVCLWNPGKRTNYSYSTIPSLRGFVFLNQEKPEEDVKVVIYINGLEDGLHGIHIHEKSMTDVKDLNATNCCDKLGGHFNVGSSWSLTDPHGTPHGSHTGDLCLNIRSKDRKAYFCYYDSKISLFEGDKRNVTNRTVVIHENEDDLGKGIYLEEDKNIASLVNGNAGKRVSCAEIRKIMDPDF